MSHVQTVQNMQFHRCDVTVSLLCTGGVRKSLRFVPVDYSNSRAIVAEIEAVFDIHIRDLFPNLP